MEEIANSLVQFIQSSGLLGVILSCFILLIESIIPVIPLLVFISVNFIILGNVMGFIVSWIFTVLGSLLSYYIFRNRLSQKIINYAKENENVEKYLKLFRNISTGKMLLIVALPFTPAFAVNIAAGLLRIDFKKYLTAILLGKVSLVIYSAYIGTSFVDGISKPIVMINLIMLITILYIGYLTIKKVFKLNI